MHSKTLVRVLYNSSTWCGLYGIMASLDQSSVKSLLEHLQADFKAISGEAKKKFPAVKEVTNGIGLVNDFGVFQASSGAQKRLHVLLQCTSS